MESLPRLVWINDTTRQLFRLGFRFKVDTSVIISQEIGPYDYDVNLFQLRDLLLAKTLFNGCHF